ncbi:hypothetical protein MPTK1_7g12790 [Marchantia polymorpha subsp. ruderalis]|uniref:Uncharacterized protein n=3 Tax=Marchantia polymorpha TaxID=3197 RepID=A0AAF6BYX3_MARPO|nr:hypothetical protein MARPO_0003s0287 [Marchantia polymorpha]BBN17207.1 hypothetical protein Mp_7g12790 [Marchantia polymorpha subsp. ruderalis]|eukprot:PTQ49442.1 hypothetical protein MARPO_0003s0287 [Marchantia polymorpha]
MNAKLHPLLLFQSPRSCIYFSFSPKSTSMLGRRALSSVTTQSATVAPSLSPTETVIKRPVQTVSEWKGLEQWRSAPIDERRVWGKSTPAVEKEPVLGGGLELIRQDEKPEINVSELAKWGEFILATPDPLEKAFLTHQAYRLWHQGDMQIGTGAAPDAPGRPSKPQLVPPREVPGPKDTELSASAHAMHNLAHIELNAIDLAWDTVVRFSYASEELGRQFFADFLHVADDESRHFRWCQQRLNELGFSYGDMPAHNLLWKDCMRTSGSVKSRLAVIPMIQEARGLDASPRLVKRLSGLADHRSAAIVRRIGEEEVAHVGVGVTWFLRVCEKLQIDPGLTFKEMMVECNIELHGPFNHTARARAGLQREWYDNSEATESTESGPGDASRYHCQDPPAVKQTSVPELQREAQVEDGRARLHPSSTDASKIAASDVKINGTSGSVLPEVYERLALLVAMEKDNAGA